LPLLHASATARLLAANAKRFVALVSIPPCIRTESSLEVHKTLSVDWAWVHAT